MSIQAYRSVFQVPATEASQEPSPCRCTIVPPHMAEKIRDAEIDSSIRYQHEVKLAADQSIRQQRAKLFAEPQTRGASGTGSEIKVYNANHKEELPGDLVSDASTSKDDDIGEAFRWARETDRFFRTIFQRNSIDDAGMPMLSTVHYGKDYSNAFWNGRQMAYGDGDDRYFNRFTIDSDITAHEITHGVTQFDMDLEYQGQSGALNESFSDVMGSMVKQYIKDEKVNEADWLIGDKLMIGPGYSLRSMKRPGYAYRDHPAFGDDPQPSTMEDYVETSSDNGGVHINSGIPNHAFYKASLKFYEINPGAYANSWNGTGKVWYAARKKITSTTTDFAAFAHAVIQTAGELYGEESPEHKSVRYAWSEVGVISVSKDKNKDNDCCVLV